MSLEDYRRKRDFAKSPEPRGEVPAEGGRRFVVHEHHATRLHFDLRLEIDGALKSWAIPKGPSMNPADKRLAVMVEDHPLEYISFRGEIAEGYGAGRVEIWDSGTFELIEDNLAGGKLIFGLFGAKLRGAFHMVRLKSSSKDWLLMKANDEYADRDWTLEQVVEGGSRRDLRERDSRQPEVKPEEPPDALPRAISPMLAILADKPFSDPLWLFEPKWDGYRAITFIEPGSFRCVSRRNLDLAQRFPQVQAIPGLVNAVTAILDGEIVAIDPAGRPSFQLLQNAARVAPHEAQLVYYVFDLLYLNGRDLRKRPLIERKEMLQPIIRASEFVRYCDHIIEHGEELYRQAQASGTEGIVAKRLQSPYVEKRSNLWLKIKAVQQQEFVVGGYTLPRGSRARFGALVVGHYEGDKLVFAGQVGTGFDDRTLKELYDLMQPLRSDTCPFASMPKTNEPAEWVKPELVCEVKFSEWTDEGILRQPVYLGLRPDKLAGEVVRERPERLEALAETPQPKPARQRSVTAEELFAREETKGDVCVDVDGAQVWLTNLDKPYWPEDGYTKGDLLRYYYLVRETIVPHLAGRPLILRRFPDGAAGESFYQHNVQDAPEFVRTVEIAENDGKVTYLTIDSAASLLYVANLGCIAQNPFSSRIGSLDKADWILLDLDPEEAPFEVVCDTAMTVKSVLDDVGLAGYPKTSGSRGMHVYIPIDRLYSHEQARDVGELVARAAASRRPDITTVERMKKQRRETQVYLDYLQNGMGKTIASPYSVRAAAGATVSTPLTWEEVAAKPDKGQFTMLTVPERLERVGDLFADVLTLRQRLTAPMDALAKLLSGRR